MEDDCGLRETTRCLCLASRRAARTITRSFDDALRDHGLRATQFTLLAALALQGPQAVNQLADLLGAERSTVSRNLAVVARNGFVRMRVSDGDARARIATVTARGRRTLQAALPAWRRAQAALVADIGEAAASGLRRLAGGPCTMAEGGKSFPRAPRHGMATRSPRVRNL